MSNAAPVSTQAFTPRHIGPRQADVSRMLSAVGFDSLGALIDSAIPSDIRFKPGEGISIAEGGALNEVQVQEQLRAWAAMNKPMTQMIGQGYFETVTPAVIRRNLVENPGWYTAYTPYQPEISQGRLEALATFQQVVADLTGLPVAGASLLDEATATSEAVALMMRANKKRSKVLVDAQLHPQVISVVMARAHAADHNVQVHDFAQAFDTDGLCGIVVAYPGTTGEVRDLASVIAAAQQANALVTIDTDLLALTVLKDPGSLGADIAVGSAQRFGVPLFFGGPHAGFIACSEKLQRQLPGRIVGLAPDADGQDAYRLALQTREQHIRREKATSNICTAQALLASMAGMYAVWHGPEGLREIAQHAHRCAHALAVALKEAGTPVLHAEFFDTVACTVPNADQSLSRARAHNLNIRKVNATTVSISFGENHGIKEVQALAEALGAQAPDTLPTWEEARETLPREQRTTPYLEHRVFHTHRSETQMMRYLRRLSDRDLALDRTMIPLGSCTMKLNAAIEMETITWPQFASIHPYAPLNQTQGWQELLVDLGNRLAKITGYDATSLQPNSGAAGEFTGLLAIRRYHDSRGEGDRRICLIPGSAHGTNAASAALAGLDVVVIKTAEDGSIEMPSLREALAEHGPKVAAIMLTYPSTHGVYEPQVREVCELVHTVGGQVYIDGANMNALVGLGAPGLFGGDVSHLNLHKTFAIPHGGGGPGVGPICVKEHLIPFLPGDPTAGDNGYPVSGANFGSAGVTPITWAYLALMGPQGLRRATEVAVLNANYIAKELSDMYPTLYVGESGLVAHECILDLRGITQDTGVTAEDVAKRLMDYGFHAPTLAFPVPGTLMVEPTESEDLEELDRFIRAMRQIYAEIQEVVKGTWPVDQSPLRQAPHTAAMLARDWQLPYSRQVAVFPLPELQTDKYFPPVRRIDGATGDRQFCCTLAPYDDTDN
ncbi:MAG: aminomethyl-transferring glycine dehydrogenase [Actinomycetaceae bacterium]|nr:aminomethyl-transferring glycine dehydrogenase [Actinomycetaceae bacterium]